MNSVDDAKSHLIHLITKYKPESYICLVDVKVSIILQDVIGLNDFVGVILPIVVVKRDHTPVAVFNICDDKTDKVMIDKLCERLKDNNISTLNVDVFNIPTTEKIQSFVDMANDFVDSVYANVNEQANLIDGEKYSFNTQKRIVFLFFLVVTLIILLFVMNSFDFSEMNFRLR